MAQKYLVTKDILKEFDLTELRLTTTIQLEEYKAARNFFLQGSATADVYSNEGNEALKKGDFINVIHFYTRGIKVNCNEKELEAKLYNNRAIAHFKLGNHQDSLRDAEAAIELNPTYLKAIVRGALACVELKRFEQAITWCDKGLAVSFEEMLYF
ncbi:unnamed protein product [Pocillopora meandrina]|uniref:Uncharacterized protein n=1 Tax=Pocillopora meandrina TaxID=46732 RepID=A0AAU9XY60_9CNID|nr:unnamed protein product [Pocillopora meandrina]